MSQTVKIDNFSALNIVQASVLNADIAAGTSVTISIPDTAGIVAGDFLALGALGSTSCEIVTVASVTNATALVITTVGLPHQRSEAVTKLFGTQVKLYRATDTNGNPPVDGSFSIVGSAVPIVPNAQTTSVFDAGGGAGYWYKFNYFNPTSSAETGLADSKVVRGGGYGDYATLAEILEEAGMNKNPNITPADVAQKRQRAQNIINSYLFEVYSTPFAVPVPPLINTCCIMLAAGYLMMAEYGQSATGTSKDGNAKILEVMDPDAKSGKYGLLDMIKMRESILTDSAGTSLLISDMISSYPNDGTDPTTTVSDPNTIDSPRYFNMSDRY